MSERVLEWVRLRLMCFGLLDAAMHPERDAEIKKLGAASYSVWQAMTREERQELGLLSLRPRYELVAILAEGMATCTTS